MIKFSKQLVCFYYCVCYESCLNSKNFMNLFHFRIWDGGADTKQTNFDFGDPAKEVEDIMKRKVSSMASPLARTLQESRLMGSSSPAGPGSIPCARPSPSNAARTLSPSSRHSPKLELELLELGNLPPPQYHTSSLTRQGTLYPSRATGNNHKL